MELDFEIWNPKYWFVLQTIAIQYPKQPNKIIKKKYYDFIQNLPLFIPNDKFSNLFSKLLDKYPLSPYLDSHNDFMKWIHFIHNKWNENINKPQINMNTFINKYYENYKKESTNELLSKYTSKYKNIFIFCICIFLIGTIIYLHKL